MAKTLSLSEVKTRLQSWWRVCAPAIVPEANPPLSFVSSHSRLSASLNLGMRLRQPSWLLSHPERMAYGKNFLLYAISHWP